MQLPEMTHEDREELKILLQEELAWEYEQELREESEE